ELMEIIAGDHTELVEKPIRKIGLPKGAIIAAIFRGMDVIIPTGDTVIEPDDKVTILCLLSELPELEKLFKRTSRFF
ncbi:MAG: TrkA C-terminal domain-containing protein, partial [Anaerovoracaceae bacterium]